MCVLVCITGLESVIVLIGLLSGNVLGLTKCTMLPESEAAIGECTLERLLICMRPHMLVECLLGA